MLLLAILKLLSVVILVYSVLLWDVNKVKYKIIFVFNSGNRRVRYLKKKDNFKKVVASYGDFVVNYEVVGYITK